MNRKILIALVGLLPWAGPVNAQQSQSSWEQTVSEIQRAVQQGSKALIKASDLPARSDLAKPRNSDGIDTSCKYNEHSFGGGLVKTDAWAPWNLFLSKPDPDNAGNSFQICLNTSQSIFTPGIPAGRYALRAVDGYQVVETATPDGFIPPYDVTTGQITGAKFKTPAGSVYDLQQRSLYYIDKGDLAPGRLAGLAANGNTAYIDKLAWVRFFLDPRNPARGATTMEVHLRPKDASDYDADKAAALVGKAFKLAEAASSTFNNDADRKAITDFVRAEVLRHKSKGIPFPNPHVLIALNVVREQTAVKEPAQVVSVVINDDDKGTKLDNGDFDVRQYLHEYLMWCYYPKDGKPAGFETGTQHRAHERP